MHHAGVRNSGSIAMELAEDTRVCNDANVTAAMTLPLFGLHAGAKLTRVILATAPSLLNTTGKKRPISLCPT